MKNRVNPNQIKIYRLDPATMGNPKRIAEMDLGEPDETLTMDEHLTKYGEPGCKPKIGKGFSTR